MELDYNELLLIRKSLTEKLDNTDLQIEQWGKLEDNGKKDFKTIKFEHLESLRTTKDNIYNIIDKIDLEINRKGE